MSLDFKMIPLLLQVSVLNANRVFSGNLSAWCLCSFCLNEQMKEVLSVVLIQSDIRCFDHVKLSLGGGGLLPC